MYLVNDTIEHVSKDFRRNSSENKYFCATAGFFKICWPNRSVLKIGFLAPPPLASPLEEVLEDEALGDGWCALENRSVVARGMMAEEKMRDSDHGQYLCLCLTFTWSKSLHLLDEGFSL